MKENYRNFARETAKYSILTLVLTIVILLIVFKLLGLVPFGGKSLAIYDAGIQYLDFFSYLKDIISGESNVGYTLYKGLGGNNIGTYSYYLTSPFNFLIVFFEKTQLLCFFHMLVVLKLAAAACTCCVYLHCRFREINKIFLVMLSVSFAFMQYDFSQCGNIMWLDAVYMLPLLLLGIYKLVNSGKTTLMSVSVALIILFNWYMGAVACMAAFLWLIIEWCILVRMGMVLKSFFLTAVRYCYAMLLGLGASMCLFLPTVCALLMRNNSSMFSFGRDLIGNPVSFLQGFFVGSVEEKGFPVLFCGSIALLGIIGFFAVSGINIKKKIMILIGIIIVAAIYYWEPLTLVFSLFKPAGSYWYRYSFLGSIFLIYAAAMFFENRRSLVRTERKKWICAIVIVLALALIVEWMNRRNDTEHIIVSVIFLLLESVFLLCYLSKNTEKYRKTMGMLLCFVLAFELGINAYLNLQLYSRTDDGEYASYVADQIPQINMLQEYDSGVYRIHQTLTRNMSSNNTHTANYNEAVSFGYMSISSYTSSSDENQIDFLNSLGYRSYEDVLNVTNDIILPADGLLAVKYILTDRQLPGLEKISQLPDANGKSVYKNEVSLPMAFTFPQTKSFDINTDNNSFELQNEIYSTLVGEKTNVFMPIEDVNVVAGSENQCRYEIELPSDSCICYAFLDLKEKAAVYKDGEYCGDYAGWLTSETVSVSGAGKHTIMIEIPDGDVSAIIENYQFYIMDVEVYKELAEKISANEIKDVVISDEMISCSVESDGSESLYLSIPYSEELRITNNGAEIEPVLLEGCLITIPLDKGVNSIEITHYVSGLKQGAGISVCSVCIIVIIAVINRRKSLKKQGKLS